MSQSPAPLQPEPSTGWEPATRFYRQLHIWALGLLIVVLLVHLLQTFAEVLQQLCIAGFLVYLIMPVQRWLTGRGVPPILAYLVILLVTLGLLTILGFILHDNIQDLIDKAPLYRSNLVAMTTDLTDWLPDAAAADLQHRLNQHVTSAEQNLRRLSSAVGTLFGLLTQLTLVVIYLLFLLWELAGIARRIDRAFPAERAQHVRSIIQGASESIESYVSVKTLASVMVGVGTTLVVYPFGVDYPIFWGILGFLLNYIPYLGSVIAVILPSLLALVQLRSPGLALLILVLLTIVHNGIGFVVEPLIAGHRLNLSPLLILVALAFWFTIWGIVGMILAVPLLVVLKAVLENIKETKPLAVLMSN
jgi:predicted PurR-regulated permease PerM